MKIGIFGSECQTDKQAIIRRLFDKLNDLGAEIFVESRFHLFLTESLHYKPNIAGIINDSFSFDMALSVGGDGTFLRTVAYINKHDIPILGINTGRLGFLADISVDDMEQTLDEVYCGKYRLEERTLLCLHSAEHAYHGFNYALNEVAVQKRDTSSMLTIHTKLNGEYLTSYQADGLVIATPTGSTAYSMSVNGPIISPLNQDIVLSPVAPHSLNVRPLIIPDTYSITLNVESRNKFFLVALDGRSEIFPTDFELTIGKANFTTKIVKRLDHSFYQTLREKLMWGADVRVR